MQAFIFTVAITCISRLLLARDLLAGKVRRDGGEGKSDGRIFRLAIASGENTLDAVFVKPLSCEMQAVMLICHGIGEVVEHWSAAQLLLAEEGVGSLVFDYSGYGRSSGLISARQCEQDALSAFLCLQDLAPSHRVSLLGFSLGSGIAAAILSKAPAHRLVLCAAFTSFRAAARSAGLPGALAFMVLPVWHTERLLATCAVPALIVHGERDRLFPVQMALDLHACCGSRSELVVVPKLSHDGPYSDPQRVYWRRIVSHLLST